MSSSSNNSKFKCNHSSQKKSKWTKIGSRKANGKAKGFKPQKQQPVQPREGLVQPRELSNRFEYLSEELSDESDYLDAFPAVAPVSRRWKFQRKKKSYKAVARTQPHSAKKRVQRALLPRQSSRVTQSTKPAAPEVSKPQSSEEEDSFLFAASGEGHHGYASPEQGPVQTKIGPSSGKSNSLSSYRPTQHSGRRKKKSYKATLKRVQTALLPRQSSRLTKRRRGSRTRSPVQPRSACGDASSRKHTSRTEFSEKYRPTSVESPIVISSDEDDKLPPSQEAESTQVPHGNPPDDPASDSDEEWRPEDGAISSDEDDELRPPSSQEAESTQVPHGNGHETQPQVDAGANDHLMEAANQENADDHLNDDQLIEAAIQQNIDSLNVLQDFDEVTSTQSAKLFCKHLELFLDDQVDYPPPPSRRAENGIVGNFFGYRGADLLNDCFDYNAVYWTFKTKHPGLPDAKFHNKFVGMRKFMAFCYTHGVRKQTMCQPHGLLNLFYCGGRRNIIVEYAECLSSQYGMSPSTVCINLKHLIPFVKFWYEWFGLKITEEEEQRAFKTTFSMRNTSSMLALVNQVASRYRTQHRTAQRNNFSTEQRRQDNKDLTQEQQKRLLQVLGRYFQRVLTREHVLIEDVDGSIEFGDAKFSICQHPFKKLTVRKTHILEGILIQMMALGGVAGQRPRVYIDFQDKEFCTVDDYLIGRLHFARGKRSRNDLQHEFQIRKQETIFGMKCWEDMLRKASPAFTEKRRELENTCPITGVKDLFWFHKMKKIDDRNETGVIPVYRARNSFGSFLLNCLRDSMENVFEATRLPTRILSVYELRKVTATNAYRLWRWTKGHPPPYNRMFSLKNWLITVANEMDTSTEMLKTNYIYERMKQRFVDGDNDVGEEYLNRPQPEVDVQERGGGGLIFTRNSNSSDLVNTFW